MPNEPEKNQEKCLTQAEVSQLLQERIAQERRRYEGLLSQQKAAREQAEAVLRERENTLRERENTLRERDEQLRAQQIRSHAQAELNRRGLPQSLLGALQCGSEEALTQSLAAVEGAFRESLERGVRDRLRGGAPSAPIGAQLPDKKQRLSYQQAASLYQKQRLAGRDNE